MIKIEERLVEDKQIDYVISRTSSPEWWKHWMDGMGFQLIKVMDFLPVYGEIGLYMKNH